jgi:ketosteroid isomerase-like protein
MSARFTRSSIGSTPPAIKNHSPLWRRGCRLFSIDSRWGQRVTTVLVKRDGRWQTVSEQRSHLPIATAADLSSGPALLQPDAGAGSKDDEQEVRTVEQEIADATGSDNATALERLWAPEFVWIGPIGQVLTAAQGLSAIRSGSMKAERYDIDDETVHLYGSTAVVSFRSTVAGVLDGKDISSQRRVTNVLVKSGGRRRAVSQHSTRIQ